MTRPNHSKSGTLCFGAAADAVELQEAGGLEKLKLAEYNKGYLKGYKDGYGEAIQDLTDRVENLEKGQQAVPEVCAPSGQ